MWIWLIVALVAAIGELLTTGLFLATMAVAAVITAIVALALHVVVAQVILFAALSLLGMMFVRPLAAGALGMRVGLPIGGPHTQSHLVGRRAVVTRTVDGSGGQIRIGEGEFWTARSFDPDDTFLPGKRVEIALVDGLTAVVEPAPEPAIESQSDLTIEKGT